MKLAVHFLQNEISCNSTTAFLFHKKILSHPTSTADLELPTEQEIFEAINECKNQAIEDSIKLGLISKKQQKISLDCKVATYSPQKKSTNDTGNEMFVEIQKEEEFETFIKIMDQLKTVHLKNYADQFDDGEPVDELSPYTEVFDAKRRIILKKQSLIWLLRKSGKKLSSDRLERVKTDRNEPSKRKTLKTRKKKKYILFRRMCVRQIVI